MALPEQSGRANQGVTMAKFDADFNNDIRRTIKSFNQKVRRAEKRGEKGLPELRSVREFKAQFTTKNDAKKELSYLKTMLNNKQALGRKRTAEGTISNWEYEYIVKNLQATKKWVSRELEKARIRVKDYPDHLYAIRADVLKLEAEKAYLERDLAKLTSRELQTVQAIERRMKRSDLRNIAGRKHFMESLDGLLTAKGMKKSERNKIYQKLNSMTNEEFLEFYKSNDVVGTIMGYYIPADKEGEVKLLEDLSKDEEVQEIINDFGTNLDEKIIEAKDSVKKINNLVEAGTGKVYSKEEYMKHIKSGNW